GPAVFPRAGDTPSLNSSPRYSEKDAQRLPSAETPAHSGRILLLLCNTERTGQQACRFGPPLLVREERAMSWGQLQQCILSTMRYLMRSPAHVPVSTGRGDRGGLAGTGDTDGQNTGQK
ncbi:hypothetical protein FKM82_023459, partial [Ascaphus truei]